VIPNFVKFIALLLVAITIAAVFSKFTDSSELGDSYSFPSPRNDKLQNRRLIRVPGATRIGNQVTVPLEVGPALDLKNVVKMGLLLATHNTEPLVQSAFFEFVGTPCKLVLPNPQLLRDNSILFLEPKNCDHITKNPTQARFILQSDEIENITFWLFARRQAASVDVFTYRTKYWSRAIRGTIIRTPYPLLSKWGIYRSIWDKSPVDFVISAACALLLIGAGLVLFKIKESLGFALFIFGLSLSYVVITPPFQAPDEPDHAEAVRQITEKEGDNLALERLADRGHFARIKFNVPEKMTSFDAAVPDSVGWGSDYKDGVNRYELSDRSPVYYLFYSLIKNIVPNSSAADFLLYLRVFNAFLVGLVVWGVSRFLFRMGVETTAQTIVFVALSSVPSIFQYTSQISINSIHYALFFAVPMVFLALFRGWANVRFFFALGAALLLISLCSRNGFLIYGFWIPFSFLLSWNINQKGFKEMLRLGLGLSVLASVTLLIRPHFLESATIKISKFSGSLPLQISPSLLIVATTLLLCLGLYLGQKIGEKILSASSNWRDKFIQTISAVTMVVLIVGPFFASTNQLQNIEKSVKNMPMVRYALTGAKKFMENLYLGQDFFVSTSFWYGFGWLDVPISERLISLCKAMPFAMLMLALFWMLKHRQTTKLWIFLGTFAALVAYVVLLGGATYAVKYNLHGRYLVGAFAIYIGFAIAAFVEMSPKKVLQYVRFPAFIALLAIHYTVLTALLDRYVQ
jgi:hypothetical protein